MPCSTIFVVFGKPAKKREKQSFCDFQQLQKRLFLLQPKPKTGNNWKFIDLNKNRKQERICDFSNPNKGILMLRKQKKGTRRNIRSLVTRSPQRENMKEVKLWKKSEKSEIQWFGDNAYNKSWEICTLCARGWKEANAKFRIRPFKKLKHILWFLACPLTSPDPWCTSKIQDFCCYYKQKKRKWQRVF